MPRFAIVAAAFLLASCSDFPKTWSRSEIEDIAYDAAEDAGAGQSFDASDLERRIGDLEATVQDQDREIRSLRSELEITQANVDAVGAY